MARKVNLDNPIINIKLAPGDKERLIEVAKANGIPTIANLVQAIASGEVRVVNRMAATLLDYIQWTMANNK